MRFAPRSMVVLALPALSKVAVSPVPGTGLALQLETLDQALSAAPDQTPLAACKADAAARDAAMPTRSLDESRRRWRGRARVSRGMIILG